MSHRDLTLARRARRHGARYCLRIIWEARRAGIPISLGFALVEHESAFRNICGHDPGGPHLGAPVTRRVVQDILRSSVSNGIGLTQLTYKGYIREAERLGGAHRPKYQLRVGFQAIGNLIERYGEVDGIKRYNGDGPAAVRYSQDVRAAAGRWHRYLRG